MIYVNSRHNEDHETFVAISLNRAYFPADPT